ncbi:DUF4269 domain-containing protein [Bacteroidales bacterium OttesenSCG-928-B11]|nr:DUF4269 domain-containing protein [Bacteroidales bacterium OttesenSCG-928-E04]MDL2311349.1 DUF4269 domain-containing protein [Bacteroidales bacterium OttesenSCG-928-B11]
MNNHKNLFLSINYLQKGTPRQQEAYHLLTEHSVMERLKLYTPILTGTIPLSIDIDTSDLDIICCYKDAAEFRDCLQQFASYPEYKLEEKDIHQQPSIIASFRLESFPVEIFGQKLPVTEQQSYRHLLIENRILLLMGDTFKDHVIKLKQQGIKTEPAFAQLLGLEGDPYEAILKV